MIVSFLCFLGPGAVAYTVQNRCICQKEAKEPPLLALLRIIAYASIIMAAVSAVLSPIGQVQTAFLAGGQPILQYSPTAMALSVILAVALGVSIGKYSRQGQLCLNYGMHHKAKSAVYAAALLFAVGLLAVPICKKDLRDMKISTMPVKINDAFYDAKIPIYFSGGGQESFISYHELAKSLGIDCGVKTPGLFQTEYYLGDDLFKVNRLTPGEHFYIKDQEVFISLTYLKQGTPFPDIHVYNDTLLADGSNREIIYIDNYARRFDYSWTQNVYIAHAFGGIDEVSYTNSLEAFQKNYQAGHRVFEVDLQLTKDQSLVAVHDQPLTKDGKLMRTKEFQKQKIKGKYTALSITDIMRLMDKYPDFYLVTDSKETQGPNMEKQFQILVQTAESINPEVLTRVIPQIYNEEMLSAIMDIYEWKSVIYTLYALSDFSEQEVIDFAYREGIQVITTLPGKSQGMFFRELFERGIQVYMHTYNTLDEFAALQQMGVHGIYTDFLTPAIDDRHS